MSTPEQTAETESSEEQTAPREVVVRVLYSGESILCGHHEGIDVSTGDLVVVPTRYGKDIGRVLGPVSEGMRRRYSDPKQITRRCTEEDLSKRDENHERAAEAMAICRDRIDEHKLPMRLVSAHYMLDNSRLLFFFSAESRVDFRGLVRDLVNEFHVRIELRQIGVRDETRLLGGLGVCGRELCCASLSDKLKPVSIKMAKVQNLSLNSMKISGPCGRLLCCLEYEFDFYKAEKGNLPPQGARLRYDGTQFKITEVNVLTHRVRLEGGDGRVLDMPSTRLEYDRKRERWQVLDDDPPATDEPYLDPQLPTE